MKGVKDVKLLIGLVREEENGMQWRNLAKKARTKWEGATEKNTK